MKVIVRAIILLLLATAISSSAEPELTASGIIGRVDSVVNAPRDQTMNMKLILVDKNGNEREREIVMHQKGSDKRTGKFLSPADQKGIAFLSLPEGVMYVYLPAFKKTRRIASHVKNTRFAGTDFTYEDMEAGTYADKYNAEIVEQNTDHYMLKLDPKPETQSEYAWLRLTIEKSTFVPTKIEYYDKGNRLIKVMKREDIEKIEGYCIARQSEMSDLKSGQKTRMVLQKVEFDRGLSDEIFTERYLQR